MHADDFTCMIDIDIEAVDRVFGKFCLQTRTITDKRHRQPEFTTGGNSTLNFNNRRIVAAHCINGNSHLFRK